MPLILPARTLDSGYEISNSLRFNSNNLSKTPSSASNRKTWTFSTWLKRSQIGTGDNVFFSVGAGTVEFGAFFKSDNILEVYQYNSGTYNFRYKTNQFFRDPSAWYHIVIACDTTQGSAGDRVKIYVNGSQITSFSTNTTPNQNLDTSVNLNTPHKIGVAHYGSGYYLGYMAQTILVDGSALAPTDFGETNDNGVWIPKAYNGSYGTNGFFLEYKQSGTGTDASGMGADTSGQDNHYAVNNLTATDVTTDTPTNNFCTLNPLADANLAGATFSEGNCKVDVGKSGVESGVISTFLLSSGKWYWESKMIDRQTASTFMIGVVASQVTGTGVISNYAGNKFYYSNNGDIHDTGASGDTGTDYGNTYDEGDIVGVALDLDNNKIYFSKNGTFQASGNPAGNSNGVSITAPSSTNLGGYIAGFGGFQTYSHVIEINFGNAPYAISSGNADANGYGNFEYAVPSGFFACCTKNLAEYG